MTRRSHSTCIPCGTRRTRLRNQLQPQRPDQQAHRARGRADQRLRRAHERLRPRQGLQADAEDYKLPEEFRAIDVEAIRARI
jgi:hypothetical protein